MSKLRTIWLRAYDDPKDKDGNDKPNELLGTFKVIQQISDDMYSEKFIGENKHGRFLITEHEVSGYYHQGLGGSRYTVDKLTAVNDLASKDLGKQRDVTNPPNESLTDSTNDKED